MRAPPAWLVTARSSGPNSERPRTPSTGAALAAPREPEPLLRVHGSNTIGSELGPALAEAYLRSKGQNGVHRRVDAAHEEAWVSGRTEQAKDAPGIEIRAAGSATAFSDLGNRSCDVGMASRPITAAEAGALTQRASGI